MARVAESSPTSANHTPAAENLTSPGGRRHLRTPLHVAMARPLSRCVRPGPRQCPLHRRQCLRVSSPVLLSRQREASDRDFHSSARRPAAPGVAQMRAHRPAAQAMQSIKGQIKEALGKGGAGDDIGLMEGELAELPPPVLETLGGMVVVLR